MKRKLLAWPWPPWAREALCALGLHYLHQLNCLCDDCRETPWHSCTFCQNWQVKPGYVESKNRRSRG